MSNATVERAGWTVLTEADIFSVVKDIPNLYMLPNRFWTEMPPPGVANPWGPTITFQFRTYLPKHTSWLTEVGGSEDKTMGDKAVMDKVEQTLKTKLASLIMQVHITYQNNGIYQAKVIQKP